MANAKTTKTDTPTPDAAAPDAVNGFDLSTLAAVDAPTDALKSTRPRSTKYADSPLRKDVLASYNDAKAKEYAGIPNDAVEAVVRELRGCARTIQTTDDTGNVTGTGIGLKVRVNASDDGKTSTVVFLGKELAKHKPKETVPAESAAPADPVTEPTA